MKRFADQCEILEGKLPQAPPWPERSFWRLKKGAVSYEVECAGDRVVAVDWRPAEKAIGGRFVTLLQWMGTRPGILKVEMRCLPNSTQS